MFPKYFYCNGYSFTALSEGETDPEHLIDPKDVTAEVLRASGVEGQHVNRTESAVRLTHIATGLYNHNTRSPKKYRESYDHGLRNG